MMDNKNVYTLNVESGINVCGSLFARRYTFIVHNTTDKGSIVSLTSDDITPSGYTSGGTHTYLLQNALVKFKEHEINKNIAKLVKQFDTKLLNPNFGDKGSPIVLKKIVDMSNQKVKAITV